VGEGKQSLGNIGDSVRPAIGTTHRIYKHPTRELAPWGEEVEVLAVNQIAVFFKSKKESYMMPIKEWMEATEIK
jgi:hypothetical protein